MACLNAGLASSLSQSSFTLELQRFGPNSYSNSVDLFSAGVVMHICFTGRRAACESLPRTCGLKAPNPCGQRPLCCSAAFRQSNNSCPHARPSLNVQAESPSYPYVIPWKDTPHARKSIHNSCTWYKPSASQTLEAGISTCQFSHLGGLLTTGLVVCFLEELEALQTRLGVGFMQRQQMPSFFLALACCFPGSARSSDLQNYGTVGRRSFLISACAWPTAVNGWYYDLSK